MGVLKNKIDFEGIITVKDANSNGDPLNGNMPRTTYDGRGEISDVCIKRKIRNRLMDMGEKIFVQSNEKCIDGCRSLQVRAENNTAFKEELKKGKKADAKEGQRIACEEWMDVRSFGQVFAFKGDISIGVRGPVSIHPAFSKDPVDITSIQITKSVNGKEVDGRAPDTMGMKHRVDFGLYIVKGSINVQLAEKTGFTEEDADKIKEALRTLFVNDASAARPDGSMSMEKLYWWKHNCEIGQYPSKRVHESLHVTKKEDVVIPKSIDDYEIALENLDGLEPEICDGI